MNKLRPMLLPAVSEARLDPAALYRAPTGRLCRLTRMDGRFDPTDAVAQLAYVRDDWSRPSGHVAEGFALTRENWRILQRVA